LKGNLSEAAIITHFGLTQTRSGLTQTRSGLTRTRSGLTQTRSGLTQTRSGLTQTRSGLTPNPSRIDPNSFRIDPKPFRIDPNPFRIDPESQFVHYHQSSMEAKIKPQIEESWRAILSDEFNKPYFSELKSFLVSEKQLYAVYPPGPLIFNAFAHTPFPKVKVVILGQDPYHGTGQAHGLSFSVPDGVKPPPSLVNMFKEIKDDLGIAPSASGNLEPWADRGVFLLNATLTVRAATAGSHQNRGWELFTDKVIETLSAERENLVFMLWGSYARAKKRLIDPQKHLILEAAHPSPFSAYNGFFGCKHFSKANNYLQQHSIEPIDWSVK
jgi:uracil-DNA glycosylase